MQPAHEEIELKWALPLEGHARLAELLPEAIGPARLLRQENRFFDTADRRLRAARMNLRLRHENGRWLMTCKHKAGNGPSGLHDGLARHTEWEEWLDGEPVLTRLPLPDQALAALAGGELLPLGGFANERLEFAIVRDGLDELLALDRTDYGVRIDHELEIETADPPRTASFWSGQLDLWGVPWSLQTETKFARFLALGGT